MKGRFVLLLVLFLSAVPSASMAAPNYYLYVADQATGQTDRFNGDSGQFSSQAALNTATGTNWPIATPDTGSPTPEGVRVIGSTLYVVDFAGNGAIRKFDYITGNYLGDFVTGTGGPGGNPLLQAAGLAVSANKQFIYVGLEGAGGVNDYRRYNVSTGALASQTSTGFSSGAHDIIVGTDYQNLGRSVYTSSRSSADTMKVQRRADDLSGTATQFLDNTGGGASFRLNSPTGMAFANNGADFYVANGVVGTDRTKNYILHYTVDSSGVATFKEVIQDLIGNKTLGVFGLEIGPDGALYAAAYSGNQVTRIDIKNGNAMSDYVVNNNGTDHGVKYLVFAPVPEASVTVMGGMALVAAAGCAIRKRRATKFGTAINGTRAADSIPS